MTAVLAQVVAALTAMIVSLAGCATTNPTRPSTQAHRAVDLGGDPYVALARTLHRRGVDVWFEADLVKAWLAGPGPFDTAVQRLGRLARAVPTAGFKVADELGYDDGLGTPDRTERFLRATREALGVAAPDAPVLVDAVVPDLGCVPDHDLAGASCVRDADAQYPAASETAMTGYLRAHLIDVLDLSTGLLTAEQYAERGLTLTEAQDRAWDRAVSLGWARLTQLQGRKALAAPDGYQGSPVQAGLEVGLYIRQPVGAGAQAVDIWTWRQPYDGATVSLLGRGLHPNPLWDALVAERHGGVHLLTHMSPSAMPTDPSAFGHECDLVASVFSGVFVAAGTG